MMEKENLGIFADRVAWTAMFLSVLLITVTCYEQPECPDPYETEITVEPQSSIWSGDSGIGGGFGKPPEDKDINIEFWDGKHEPRPDPFRDGLSTREYVWLTVDELTEITQTFEDRLEVLEKTMEACCATEFRDLDTEKFLELLRTLMRQIEDLEVRLLVLEGGKDG